jgi:PP-loop superfamily ATP-utilizing enzyme
MSDHSDQLCGALVKKVIAGQKLDDTEKAHLANCKGCMEELVGKLDQADTEETAAIALAGASEDDLARSRPEVRRALEIASQVFAREFGISLTGK